MMTSNPGPCEPVLWRIIPQETPRLWKYCSGCGEHRSFYSSDKFRVNAQGKQLDAWLIYRCSVCDTTWNREILARIPVNRIQPGLLEKIQQNHKPTALDYAFDVPHAMKDPNTVNPLPEIRVECSCKDLVSCRRSHREIMLRMDVPCHVRLDRLLSAGLDLSRSYLLKLYKAGTLRFLPDAKGILKKKARDGQIILMPDLLE